MASGEVRLFLEHAGAVGLAVCLATLLDGAAPQSGIFGIGAGSEEFLLSSLISFAFVCLLAAVRFALSADDPKRLMAFGGLLASLGFVAFEFVRVPGIEIPMGVGCGALFGFGLGTSCVYWGASFGSLGQQKAVAVLALVCLFAGLFRVALLLLPQPWQGGLFGVLLVILVVNKWDLVEKDEKTMQKKEKELRSQFKYLDYARIIFLSAKTHQRVQQLFPLIQESFENSHKRVQTSVLNDVLVDAQAINPTTTFNGGRLKIFYANQVSICPPTFVLFVNDPQYMHFSYKRYLENRLRDSFGFEGTPIHIICRKRD